jgi:hypothetical protein
VGQGKKCSEPRRVEELVPGSGSDTRAGASNVLALPDYEFG